MKKIIGFIGAGNMGQAMVGGIVKSKLLQPQQVMMADRSEERLKVVSKEYGIKVNTDNKEVAKNADVLILSVKPNIYAPVIEEIKDIVKEDVIIITIAAGKDISGTEKGFGRKLKVVRAMPNTPALVGEGMTSISPNEKLSNEEIDEVVKILKSFGKVEIVNEKLMNAVTSVSGSSPAYVFMFIEAMADGAVLDGIPRDQAYRMAAQAVLGSAKMVLDTGMHPGALKDMVCSPSGTTIEAVTTLEKTGFRAAVISAMKSCTNKSIEMSK
ncbi:pyrroline-5-carboxylate reductase [Marinisporobacter balticus]|uniref:Pyrroline-5-carboxylate reductase n=1 Tax=Marinisporobacter balticus TaxID=2018667 RepID=A0A4R2KUL6_9FIRM|nr:pyrroline-5-carboxylate reductase [Marinisporobacter balticus]TCO74826.1 pyrroline-5-carboxylate reductase [Marinisporobacter balticus]